MAQRGATKQRLYTAALLAIGHRKFLTSESKEAVRVLDDVYDDVLEECLTMASWNFATQFVKLDGDTGLPTYEDTGSKGYGYRYGFTKPTDWLRTHGMSADEFFSYPLRHYVDEDNIIKSEQTPIYMRYVSNDTGAGLELTKWPRNFTRYVELELAYRVCFRLTQDDKLEMRILELRDRAKRTAMSHDAMDEATKTLPPNSWTSARWGRHGSGDRGLRNKFTGG
jgi:hypothetical protein